MLRDVRLQARVHAHRAVMGGIFGGLSTAGRMLPFTDPKWHGVSRERNVAYGPHPSHVLDVYRPVRPGPHPVVMYVHGGAFTMLSKETHWSIALTFARAGYTVFNIGYRLAPRHSYPAPLEDTCKAFEWVVLNAESHGGDLSRLAIAGESAGANLVAALTVALCYERPEPWARRAFSLGVVPRVTIPACGVLQASDTARLWRRRPMNAFVRRNLRDVSDFYLARADPNGPGGLELADPLLILERGDVPARQLPGFFVPVGTRDPLLDDSRRLGEALTRLNVDHRVVYYPGEVHAFQALLWRRQARQCWRDTFEFMRPHLRHPH